MIDGRFPQFSASLMLTGTGPPIRKLLGGHHDTYRLVYLVILGNMTKVACRSRCNGILAAGTLDTPIG